MEYIGEHTLPGQLGNLFTAIAFAAALLSIFAYFLATRPSSSAEQWRKIGRYAFITHAMSVFTMVGILFYLLVSQYYEYDYVAEQSKNDMSMRYILVAFWGGQRGSFMLWLFWQAVLGLILLRTSKKWEPSVMTIFAGIQLFLVSMVLGITYWDNSLIGINPFALKREVIPDWGTLWSAIPEYLQLDPSFQDGKGLNPLLQNYWMVIHPPTLFLGFSLVSVPFAYALAALWKKDLSGWLKPALPWTFFGIAILGIGILMGGAWAYESLSFGGFWAWDPVENASFVPWLVLVGAGHLMLLNKTRPSSLFTTFLLTIFSFFLVLYSTFLTRSGVLGEESVHSFTGDGLMGQLLLFMIFFLFLGFLLLIQNKKLRLYFSGVALILFGIYLFVEPSELIVESGNVKFTVKSLLAILGILASFIFLYAGYHLHFPKEKKEEDIWSREFWMFIGSLILLLSAVQIIFTTSLPVINLLFDTDITKVSTEERNAFYNAWQLPFAMIVAILSAIGQFFKYKKTDSREFLKKMILPLVLSAIFTLLFNWLYSFTSSSRDLLLSVFMFTSFFTVFANGEYWWRVLKGKLNFAGASIAHIGFGLILLGTIWSMGRQENLSENRQGFMLQGINKNFDNNLDVQVFKGDTVRMKNYFITYSGNKSESHFLFYQTTYFDVKNAEYQKGDTVKHENGLFVCEKEHTASLVFYRDKSYWKMLTDFSSEDYLRAKRWDYLQCGDKLFDVEPFVQVHQDKKNPRSQMQTVSEPGTVHFPHYDIFTHLKDANLALAGNEKYVRKYSIDTLVGDTIRTAGFLVTTSNLIPIKDSIRFPKQTALSIDFSIYDVRDFFMQFPVKRTLLFAFDSLGNSTTQYQYIPAMRIKLGLERVTIEENPAHMDHSGHNHAPGDTTAHEQMPPGIRYKLDLVTEDYIVLQVRKFPLINVLWLGCIVMFIGTLMAVIYRIKLARNSKVETEH